MEPYLERLVPDLTSAATRRADSQLPPGGSETLSPEAVAAEQAILALRLDRGMDEESASRPPMGDLRRWAETAGLLEAVVFDGERRFRLTTRGRLLSNELFVRLV
jgi:coproporphyrinogen III oxidase-like Fe-S oxidoreductase